MNISPQHSANRPEILISGRFFIFSIAFLYFTVLSLWSQSIVQFGFEELPAGSTPPFVTQIYPQPALGFQPKVADSSITPAVAPFEGQRFLYASGIMLMQSPNGQPIQSFTVHVFLPPPSVAGALAVAGQSIQEFGVWRTVQGSFTTPVQNIAFNSVNTATDSWIPYAVDSVDFVTIPEPETFWLLSIGLTAIALPPTSQTIR